MAFFDTYIHDDGQPSDFGLFRDATCFDLVEDGPSIRDSSDFNGSHFFRDPFGGSRSGLEHLPYHDVHSQPFPPPEMTSSPEQHAPSAHPSSAADPPMPPPRGPKRPDESDSSCRPRLTPEQTQILEEYYSHTPRPTTQQKRQHALKLGLTQEKVNNWFQNRRAKSKQQSRIRREFEIWPACEHGPGLPPHDLALRSFPNGLPHHPFHHASASEHAMHLHMLPSNAFAPPGAQPAIFDDHQWPFPDFDAAHFDHARRPAEFDAGPYDVPKDLQPLDLASHGLDFTHDLYAAQRGRMANLYHTHSNQSLQSMDASASSHSSLFPAASAASGSELSAGHRAGSTESQGRTPTLPSNIVTTQLDQDQSALLSDSESPQVGPLGSISTKQSPVEISRRGSLASDLASNLGTIHLQRMVSNPTSSPPSDDEAFATPAATTAPPMGLAARRNRPRPAALSAKRNVSLPSPQASPREVMLARTLRHNKSSGANLNVGASRVAKPGSLSGQRSPRSFSTFREAGQVLDRLATESLDTLLPAQGAGAREPAAHQHPYAEAGAATADPEGALHGTASPADSLRAGCPPPLSATFASPDGTGSASHAAPSPPFTPFHPPGPAPYNHPHHPPVPQTLWLPHGHHPAFADDGVPQSAPAHITAFPGGFSSLATHDGCTGSPEAYFTPQPCSPRSYFPECPPPPPPPQQHQPPSLPSSQSAPALPSHPDSAFGAVKTEPHSQQQPQQQLLLQPPPSRPASSTAGQFTFFAAPPPAAKELEVVMATFPAPTGAAAPPPSAKARLPQHFSFQNSGPQDFA